MNCFRKMEGQQRDDGGKMEHVITDRTKEINYPNPLVMEINEKSVNFHHFNPTRNCFPYLQYKKAMKGHVNSKRIYKTLNCRCYITTQGISVSKHAKSNTRCFPVSVSPIVLLPFYHTTRSFSLHKYLPNKQ